MWMENEKKNRNGNDTEKYKIQLKRNGEERIDWRANPILSENKKW